MTSDPTTETRPGPVREDEALAHLRTSIESGVHWPVALLEAMALWSAPEETYRGRRYNYFIGGEAIDWLLLAERLCDSVTDLIPQKELEDFLFTGRLPASFDATRFNDLLGVDKYRGYLNFFYGVTVEEALQHATDLEVQKRALSNGKQYVNDTSDEVCVRLYREPRDRLLDRFRDERGYQSTDSISLAELKEFTYWLFQLRLKNSDKARAASDTRKGLQQLQQMNADQPLPAGQPPS